MFIVFEGGDGSGKTTQSKALAERLRNDPSLQGREVVHTREPGGTPGAEEIRALLLSGSSDKWSPETEILLFNAARLDHVQKVIKPALDRGAIVICDRFVGSTVAYQGVRSQQLAEKAFKIHDEMIGLNPDLTILLERPGNAADAHVDARGRDRMEEVQANFRVRTKSQFRKMMHPDTSYHDPDEEFFVSSNDPSSWVAIFAGDKAMIEKTIDEVVNDRLVNLNNILRRPQPQRFFMDEEYCKYFINLSQNDDYKKWFDTSKNKRNNRIEIDLRMKSVTNPYHISLDVGDEGVTFYTDYVKSEIISDDQEVTQANLLELIEARFPDVIADLNGVPREDEGLSL